MSSVTINISNAGSSIVNGDYTRTNLSTPEYKKSPAPIGGGNITMFIRFSGDLGWRIISNTNTVYYSSTGSGPNKDLPPTENWITVRGAEPLPTLLIPYQSGQDISLINTVKQRSTSNIVEIKRRLIAIETTLSSLTTARNNLIDAIVRDAGEAINFWQLEIKKLKQQIQDLIAAFIVAISAQEKTIAALSYINKKYVSEEAKLKSAVTSKSFRKWPSMWGGSKKRTQFQGDTVTFSTPLTNLPALPPDYKETTISSPYTAAELTTWKNSTDNGLKTVYSSTDPNRATKTTNLQSST